MLDASRVGHSCATACRSRVMYASILRARQGMVCEGGPRALAQKGRPRSRREGMAADLFCQLRSLD